jgi:hypothetical protein
MIRRGFWLTAGAVTGIYGYRRVSAIGRRLSASLNPAGPGVGPSREARMARAASRGRRGALNAARETYRFTRDVREGMELYTARHPTPAGSGPAGSTPAGSAPASSTLGARDLERARDPHDQTNHDQTNHDQTNHDPRPKDGH